MKRLPTVCITLMLSCGANSQSLIELDKEQPIEAEPAIEASFSASKMSFRTKGKGHGGTITITGPNGYHSVQSFVGSSDSVNLYDSDSLAASNYNLPAGRYHYRIATHIGPTKLVKEQMDNGRGDKNYTYAGEPLIEMGTFVVEGGAIKEFSQTDEPEAAVW